MRRFGTQTLVWLIVVSLLAATPITALTALSHSPELALSSAPDEPVAAPSFDADSHADAAVHRVDQLFYYHDKTEEEARDASQHAKHLSPCVDALPGVQSDAVRQLLLSVSRGDHIASTVTRHLRL